MSFKFIINPVIYGFLLSLEITGMYLISQIMTNVRAEKSRLLKGLIALIVTVFILDVFVFNYHKTGIRSLLIFIFLFLFLKYVNQLSYKKTGLQLLIIFLSALILDIIVQLFAGALTINSIEWLFSYFSLMYALYIGVMYMAIILMQTMHVKVFDFN